VSGELMSEGARTLLLAALSVAAGFTWQGLRTAAIPVASPEPLVAELRLAQVAALLLTACAAAYLGLAAMHENVRGAGLDVALALGFGLVAATTLVRDPRQALTIVALGPLSNIAAVLQGRPDLASKVERLVAVMGRRPGHLFHPAEGAPGAALLGHGPVFSDFNFAQDPQATATVLSFQFPMTLIPYDAARQVEITREHLDRLAARDGAHAWVAERSRAWLQFWNEDMGRKGFYPFDLMAAGYVMRPQLFECAEVVTAIARDSLFLVPWRDQALLVTQRPVELEHAEAARRALYCPALQPDASSYFAAKQ
jgi:hypothetical protein